MRKHFFPWGTTFFGSIFFDTLSGIASYAGITPGAKLDDDAAWYDSADDRDVNGTRIHNPPYANLQGLWSTCNKATIEGTSHSCQILANIIDWFKGTGFPAAWGTNAATVSFNAWSSCQNDALMQGYVECTGFCKPSGLGGASSDPQDTGCCMLNKPFVMVPANGVCPAGYSRSLIRSNVTDFLFRNGENGGSQDTTLINFLTLLATRKYDFDNVARFVGVQFSENGICIINGTGFDKNVEGWGNKTYTENCPYPLVGAGNGSRGCPQILSSGGLQACTGAACPNGAPSGNSCPPGGCPSQTPNCVGAACDASAGWVTPSLSAGALLSIMFVA
jgi:hypothetical protein